MVIVTVIVIVIVVVIIVVRVIGGSAARYLVEISRAAAKEIANIVHTGVSHSQKSACRRLAASNI